MNAQVPLTLNKERLLDRGQKLAEKLAVRDDMVAAEKRRRKQAKEDLDAFDAEISNLAGTIRAGYENVAQGELFADQELATEALADVAKLVCSCDPLTVGNIHDPGCPVHGVDAPKPAPREPRTMGECGLCHQPLVEARDHQNGGEVIGWTCRNQECGDAGLISDKYRHEWEPGANSELCAICENAADHELHSPVAEGEEWDGGGDEADMQVAGENADAVLRGEEEPEEAEVGE